MTATEKAVRRVMRKNRKLFAMLTLARGVSPGEIGLLRIRLRSAVRHEIEQAEERGWRDAW